MHPTDYEQYRNKLQHSYMDSLKGDTIRLNLGKLKNNLGIEWDNALSTHRSNFTDSNVWEQGLYNYELTIKSANTEATTKTIKIKIHITLKYL